MVAALLVSAPAHAVIDGVTDTSSTPAFSLTASAGYVSVPDGGSIYAWGYATGSTMQLPGPTFIVNEGAAVTVTLTNALPAAAGNVSIVFPGHQVTATGGAPGLLTQEAPPGGSVTYTFTASQPGTYLYHSGTRPDLQVEMGLYGALIVRPNGVGFAGCAYDHAATCFDREYLFLLSEIDIELHRAAELQASGPGPWTSHRAYHSEYWPSTGARRRTRWPPRAVPCCRRSPTTACRACTPASGFSSGWLARAARCIPSTTTGTTRASSLVTAGCS
jgi:FtsP/CotA-like multicopper oxidase with cupredoxin domain